MWQCLLGWICRRGLNLLRISFFLQLLLKVGQLFIVVLQVHPYSIDQTLLLLVITFQRRKGWSKRTGEIYFISILHLKASEYFSRCTPPRERASELTRRRRSKWKSDVAQQFVTFSIVFSFHSVSTSFFHSDIYSLRWKLDQNAMIAFQVTGPIQFGYWTFEPSGIFI